jgi:hypothetical protein
VRNRQTTTPEKEGENEDTALDKPPARAENVKIFFVLMTSGRLRREDIVQPTTNPTVTVMLRRSTSFCDRS